MKLIESIQEQIENDISHSKVTQEAFDLWKSNEVTLLFMAHMKELYMESLTTQPIGSQEEVFAQQIQRKVSCDLLEQFIEWIPLKD